MRALGSEPRSRGYRIGDLTVDLVRREIRRERQLLPCGKLTFEFLALLAEQAPKLVSRAFLAERLWAGRYVSPATIKRRVALLRETLGDRAEDPVYLRIVRGHGYTLIPRVRSLPRYTMRPGPAMRLVAAAGALALMFVLGAELGYQDGMTPAIPGRQGTETVIVTSWPNDLSPAEYGAVMDAAEGFIEAVRQTDFITRLNRLTPDVKQVRADPLTVVARAETNDVETIYLTLALLRDFRPDSRPSRDQELSRWARELQDRQRGTFREPEALTTVPLDASRAVSGDLRAHVLPGSTEASRNLTLVANYRFDRFAPRVGPGGGRAAVAESVATAIDQQLARYSETGHRR